MFVCVCVCVCIRMYVVLIGDFSNGAVVQQVDTGTSWYFCLMSFGPPTHNKILDTFSKENLSFGPLNMSTYFMLEE